MQKYDIVIYGATGFTGSLIAEYLAERVVERGDIRWALAGRNIEKLTRVRDEIGASKTPIILADYTDPASLKSLAESTRLVLTAVGPYSLYGTPLVAACAAAGTDYLDLTGEPQWIRKMIDDYSAEAVSSGARILFACGFDSIPSEVGMQLLQDAALEKFGKTLPKVRGRMVKFIGGPGGGSIATGMAMGKAAAENPEVAALLADPFALTPGFTGPAQPTGMDAGEEPDVGKVQPFFLGPTNVKNVHRSNMLMNHKYGTDLVYDEMLAVAESFTPPAGPPLQPGEGPTREAMNNGCFELLLIGKDDAGHSLSASVASSKDPGFMTTSRIITETALLLLDSPDVKPGTWTPGAALYGKLAQRLEERAFMTLKVLN